eukprot:PLAT5741.1.p1 GENE.PLAT5741.1~~PLAT5741.1.p1  ORF type:complete len:210 (+),score=50.46 PLAT5741.1:56-685(+)
MKFMRVAILLLLAAVLPAAVLGCSGSGSKTVEIGKKTYVCVGFNGTASNGLRVDRLFAFRPVADDMTAMVVEGGYDALTAAISGDISVTVASMDVSITLPSIKKFVSGPSVVSVLTAIVTVDKGTVINVSWDNGCYACDADVPSQCVAGLDCGGNANQCDKGSCDPRVYVVWSGTDADGNFFTSSRLRFSRFQSYSVRSLYKAAETLID